jgi:penicillin-binding protein 1A
MAYHLRRRAPALHNPIAVPRLPSLREIRDRLRPDPERPARLWMRERWRSLTALAVAVLAVVVFDAWLATCGFRGCPTGAEIRSFRPAEGGRILDRNGQTIGRIAVVRRVNVPLSQVPVHVRQAFIATEDRRFFEHNGLDWRGFARAAVRNVAALGVREGFSTITMQVARNTYVARLASERSLRRKLMELRVARLLEQHLTKDRILELYLNVIYLGNGVYGVEAASRDLFGRSVEHVTVAEGAMLAALPKGPSAYTPRRDPARAVRRRNLVLALMAEEGYITEQRASSAARQPLDIEEKPWRPRQPDESYPHDVVRALVDSVLRSRSLQEGDVTVYTTIDIAAQRAAERAVRSRAAAIQRESREWYGGNTPVEGAMVALDPRTGDIRAMVGGRSYERGGFNRATSARRQPGSAFKPFVYAAALAAGLTSATPVDDDPVQVEDGGGQIWTPANYGDEYMGRITLRRALMRSANAATVRVSRAVGEERVVALARRNGIVSPLRPVPAIALGSVEVTPLELVAAYAPFANGGFRVRPRLVRRIEAADGTLLWSSEPVRTPAMDPRDAYQLTSMLRAAVDHGTGRVVRSMGVRGAVAGKTGTTNDGADVWFVGYTPTLVAGFWFGHDNPRSLSGDASGGRLAAPAWAEFYRNGWRERTPEGAWAPPGGMVMRVIDAQTGELASEWCPVTQREWFKRGTEPTIPCGEHGPPDDEFDPDEDWLGGMAGRISERLRRVFRY